MERVRRTLVKISRKPAAVGRRVPSGARLRDQRHPAGSYAYCGRSQLVSCSPFRAWRQHSASSTSLSQRRVRVEHLGARRVSHSRGRALPMVLMVPAPHAQRREGRPRVARNGGLTAPLHAVLLVRRTCATSPGSSTAVASASSPPLSSTTASAVSVALALDRCNAMPSHFVRQVQQRYSTAAPDNSKVFVYRPLEINNVRASAPMYAAKVGRLMERERRKGHQRVTDRARRRQGGCLRDHLDVDVFFVVAVTSPTFKTVRGAASPRSRRRASWSPARRARSPSFGNVGRKMRGSRVRLLQLYPGSSVMAADQGGATRHKRLFCADTSFV